MTAPGYGCEGQDCANQIDWLVTNLRAGQTFSLCDDDFPSWLIALLATELGVEAGKLHETIKRYVDREQAKAAKAAAAQAPAAAAAGSDGQADDDPPERTDDTHGDAVDDQGGLSESPAGMGAQ